MAMTAEFQEALYAVLMAVAQLLAVGITIVGGYLLLKLRIYVEAKIGAEQYEWVRSFVLSTVTAIEQNPAFRELANEEKKQQALEAIQRFCTQHGLTYSIEQIDQLIEEAVHNIKIEF